MGEGKFCAQVLYNPHPHSYGYSPTTATSPSERCYSEESSNSANCKGVQSGGPLLSLRTTK